jgi:hypothetical protein
MINEVVNGAALTPKDAKCTGNCGHWTSSRRRGGSMRFRARLVGGAYTSAFIKLQYIKQF